MPSKPYAKRPRRATPLTRSRKSRALSRAYGEDLAGPGGMNRDAPATLAALRAEFPGWEIGPGALGMLVADFTDGTRSHRIVARTLDELWGHLEDIEDKS